MIRKAIIVSIAGIELTKQETFIFKKEKPWGVILFKRNILSENQLINLIKSIKKIMKDNKYPILIDEEGGNVSRLSNFLDNSLYNQKYFGDIYKLNKKKINLNRANIYSKIENSLTNLPLLKNDTQNVIKFNSGYENDSKKIKRNFWNLFKK